jgi:hypothetical protein
MAGLTAELVADAVQQESPSQLNGELLGDFRWDRFEAGALSKNPD